MIVDRHAIYWNSRVHIDLYVAVRQILDVHCHAGISEILAIRT